MRKALHTTALLLVLAAQTTDSSCQDTSGGALGYACHVVERGLRMEHGDVTDEVRNWCEVGLGPQSQTFVAWIQTRRNAEDRWLVSGRSSPSDLIPDQEGVPHDLNAGRCQADIEYSTGVADPRR